MEICVRPSPGVLFLQRPLREMSALSWRWSIVFSKDMGGDFVISQILCHGP